MARSLRVEYEGAIYHVMNRGDRSEAIFCNDDDRQRFLRTLGEACSKAGWQVHAYCLMKNHFHFVIETPHPTLVDGMKWFLGTYTQRFNARHRMVGHLFAGRYKALLVDHSETFYLRVVCNYVHLNPARAGLIPAGRELSDYEWSSYPQYLTPPSRRPTWLRVDRLLGELGIKRDDAAGRRKFRDYMEWRSKEEDPTEREHWKSIRRGWRFGAEDFLQRLVEMGVTDRANRSIHGGEAVFETMEQKARRLISAFLRSHKMGMEELRSMPKGEQRKVQLAVELRKQTTMTVSWIAQELNAGAPQTLWGSLRRFQELYDNTRD
jgi:putative transposase